MTLTNDEKREAIKARRGGLDHELYNAELDLKVQEETENEDLIKEPRERVKRIKKQIAVLDKEEAKIKD